MSRDVASSCFLSCHNKSPAKLRSFCCHRQEKINASGHCHPGYARCHSLTGEGLTSCGCMRQGPSPVARPEACHEGDVQQVECRQSKACQWARQRCSLRQLGPATGTTRNCEKPWIPGRLACMRAESVFGAGTATGAGAGTGGKAADAIRAGTTTGPGATSA